MDWIAENVDIVFAWYLACCFVSYGVILAWALHGDDHLMDDEPLIDHEINNRDMARAARIIAFAGSIYGPVSLLFVMIKTRAKYGARWTV